MTITNSLLFQDYENSVEKPFELKLNLKSQKDSQRLKIWEIG